MCQLFLLTKIKCFQFMTDKRNYKWTAIENLECSSFMYTFIYTSVTGVSFLEIYCDHPSLVLSLSAAMACRAGRLITGRVHPNNQLHSPACCNCQLLFGGGVCSPADPNISRSTSLRSIWWSFMAFYKNENCIMLTKSALFMLRAIPFLFSLRYDRSMDRTEQKK